MQQAQAVVCAGWYNLLGQVAVTASIEFTLANHLVSMIVLGTGGAGTGGHVFTQGQLLGIYAGLHLLGLWSLAWRCQSSADTAARKLPYHGLATL